MKKMLDILAAIPSFQGLSENQLNEIKKNEPELVSLNISKVQLASLLGTTPETLSRILSQMADSGLIEVKKRDIRIRDHSGLEGLAEYGKNIDSGI